MRSSSSTLPVSTTNIMRNFDWELTRIEADEANFIQPPITVMLGRDEPMIEDGKVVQEGRN